MPFILGVRCQEKTEDREQKTDDRRPTANCFLSSDFCRLLSDCLYSSDPLPTGLAFKGQSKQIDKHFDGKGFFNEFVDP